VTGDWHARADRLAAESIGAGEPTAWFDRLYAAAVAGEVDMPWSRDGAHAALAEWTSGRAGAGRRAVVVGCGLGADAAHLARLGWATTAFDISPTAVEEARRRHAGSGAEFAVGDLLALPEEWRAAFDLVVEVFTLQALPDPPRGAAAAAVVDLVAPGGTLLAVQFRADGSHPAGEGPPFPLARGFMESLAGDRLDLVGLEELDGPLWRAEYRRACSGAATVRPPTAPEVGVALPGPERGQVRVDLLALPAPFRAPGGSRGGVPPGDRLLVHQRPGDPRERVSHGSPSGCGQSSNVRASRQERKGCPGGTTRDRRGAAVTTTGVGTSRRNTAAT